MSEPSATDRAEAVRRFMEGTLGVRAPRIRTRRPIVEDDDVDLDIGAAQVEPDVELQVGRAQIESDNDDLDVGAPRETVVPEIRIEGDPSRPVVPQRVNNALAALPSFISEPLGRAVDDPNSTVGRIVREGGVALDAMRVADPFDNENLDRMLTFGERGRDALPLGFGDEIAASDYDRATGGAYSRPRRLDDLETTRHRGLNQPLESDAQRDRAERRTRAAAHPIVAGAGTIAGTLPSALMMPGPTAATIPGRIAQAGAMNAGLGMITGAGLADAEDDPTTDDDEEIGARIKGGLEGGAWGLAGGVVGQTLGEGVGALRRAWQLRNNPGPALDTVGDIAATQEGLAVGPQRADDIRALTARENAPARPGMFPDDDMAIGPVRTVENPPAPSGRWTDDIRPQPGDTPPSETIEEQARRVLGEDEWARRSSARSQERTGPQAGGARGRRMRAERLANPDDVVSLDAPRRYSTVDDEDEFLGAVRDRPQRLPPQMPQQGPELRAAAMRGERSFGARGDAALDPSIRATDELSAMARDYAQIESGVGGFQVLKDRRIAQAMADAPPPQGWDAQSALVLDEVERRLEAITRHAGANPRIANATGEARYALERARDLMVQAEQFGRPLDPAELYRQINRANMSIGRAAAAEARGTGSGMQHTTAFAEPLTESYQRLRGFLADESVWGAAARVQRELNSSTAPLLRTGRALRDRVGPLFQDSGEAGAGGFRTLETARPDAVRAMMSRSGDDAYRGERELLRAWVENYGEQGATLARISQDPALAPAARAMQERASRLLDLLDQAEVEGRAAQMLANVQGTQIGGRGPNLGSMIRLASRIESGELQAPQMQAAMDALEALESALGRTGSIEPAASSAMDNANAAPPPSDQAEPTPSPPPRRWRQDLGQDAPAEDETAQLPRVPAWRRALEPEQRIR